MNIGVTGNKVANMRHNLMKKNSTFPIHSLAAMASNYSKVCTGNTAQTKIFIKRK